MRRPPSISDFPHYPVTGGTIALAVGVTAAWKIWDVDVSILTANAGIERGELWRLLTSILPHVDVFHILFNAYWTWVFGTLIEQVFGHLKTFAIFCLFGIVSGAAEYAVYSGGVGLSGVGYGLFGMLWILSSRDPRFREAVDKNTATTFVAWFFLCIALTYMGTPIGNVAHGVGAIMGALLGFTICAPRARRAGLVAANAAIAIAAVLAAVFGRAYVNLSHDGSDEDQQGYTALMADRNDEAVRWLEEAIHINPNDAYGWFDLGIAYGRMNKTHQADAAYLRAWQLDPNNRSYAAAAGKTAGEAVKKETPDGHPGL